MTHAASPARPRARVTRRALVGAAWTLAWTLVWACMLMMFASRARAAPLTLAVSSAPVSLPIQYFLDSWLVYNGIDPRSVTVVGMAPDKLAPALQARDVDAIAIWEPIASSAALALGGDAVTFASPRVYTQHFNLVASRPLLERRADDVTRLLRALVRADHAIQSEPEAARALLSERLHLPPSAAATALDNEDYRIRLDQSLVTTMQSQARWAAHGTGATRAGVDLLQLIDPAPLRRVEAAAVGIVE